jgi:hypothetical protein
MNTPHQDPLTILNPETPLDACLFQFAVRLARVPRTQKG